MALNRTPWTEETEMPWGKHQGTPMGDVPNGYLAWLLEQNWISEWPGLHAYLRSIEDELIADRADDEADDFRSYEDFRDSF